MGAIDYNISDKHLELLARMLIPEIKKFFADDEVKKEFELWQAKQKSNTSKDKE